MIRTLIFDAKESVIYRTLHTYHLEHNVIYISVFLGNFIKTLIGRCRFNPAIFKNTHYRLEIAPYNAFRIGRKTRNVFYFVVAAQLRSDPASSQNYYLVNNFGPSQTVGTVCSPLWKRYMGPLAEEGYLSVRITAFRKGGKKP